MAPISKAAWTPSDPNGPPPPVPPVAIAFIVFAGLIFISLIAYAIFRCAQQRKDAANPQPEDVDPPTYPVPEMTPKEVMDERIFPKKADKKIFFVPWAYTLKDSDRN
ncbi:hypothetical protein HDU97_007891 [Phlyctochytrium planicorne]|nr:hypothetical protein HDU97_007891 [Phlyctochytrium planicorne]